MRMDELMEVLEIEDLEEFEFFEHFSALMECSEEIEYDLFYKVLSDVDAPLLAELTEHFFEDLIQGVPDDAMSFYALLNNIKTTLCDAAKESNSKQDRLFYIEELYRFRNWYVFDSVVAVQKIAEDFTSEITVFEALTLYRLEKLGEDKYDYDFTKCSELLEDEHISTIDPDYYDDDGYGDDSEDSLIDKDNPIIDEEGAYGDEDY